MSDQPKRLYKSQGDRMIAGVCGGIADYLSVDPTIVRILFVLAALAGGPGIIAYVILMFVVPEEPAGGGSYTPPPPPTVDPQD